MEANVKQLKIRPGTGGVFQSPRERKGKQNFSVDSSHHHLDLKLIISRLEFLLEATELTDQDYILEEVRLYISSFNVRSKSRGELEAVAYYKNLANFAKRKLLGDKPEPLPFTKTTKDNIPEPLAGLWKLSQRCRKTSIYVQTVLNFYLGQVDFEAPPDFSTIEGPKDDVPAELIEEFGRFVRDLPLTGRLHKINKDSTGSLKISGSKGIFAQSFCSIPRERIVLLELNHNLCGLVCQMYRETGRDWLEDVLRSPAPVNKKLPLYNEEPYLRRMAILPEPGNKLRYITIADFWSQNALLPIHEAVMAMLKSIPEDATYRASESFEFLRQKSETGIAEFHCYDLKNFTDYLPVSLQMIIVREFFGSKIAVLWKEIIGQPILVNPPNRRVIQFTRGQPMGLLSSWAVASLCHHYLVAWSQRREGKKRCIYRLLGDDIAIWGKRAGLRYLKLLELLRIPFSIPKTITSRAGFEFCKRRCVNGTEITPVPLKALISKSIAFAGYEILRNFHVPNKLGVKSVELLVQLINKGDPSFPIDSTFPVLYEEMCDRSYDIASYAWLKTKPKLRKVMPAAIASRPRREIFARGRIALMMEKLEAGRASIEKLLKFKLSHLAFREKVKRGSKSKIKKIRGWIDKPTEFLGYLAIAQYIERMERIYGLVAREEASPTWNILGDSESLELSIFEFDPRKRFENGREKVVLDQIKTVRAELDAIGKGRSSLMGLIFIAEMAQRNRGFFAMIEPTKEVVGALPSAPAGSLQNKTLSMLVIVGKTIGLKEQQVWTLLSLPLNKAVKDLCEPPNETKT